jgi:hypothetical protein
MFAAAIIIAIRFNLLLTTTERFRLQCLAIVTLALKCSHRTIYFIIFHEHISYFADHTIYHIAEDKGATAVPDSTARPASRMQAD